MYRFFINPEEINWQEKSAVISSQNDSYKIFKVLRMRKGDQVTLLDGKGLSYNAQVESFFSKQVQCSLLSRQVVSTEPELKITIAQALIKGQRFDYSLQKNTEAGVCKFIPLVTERTVVKIDDRKKEKALEEKNVRFQKIVKSAAEQSERGIIPEVKDVQTLEELCRSNLSNYNLKLICAERSQANGIREVLNSLQERVQSVIIIIGPEGGLTKEEFTLAKSNGFEEVSLGKRIYRSETVGTVISSILFFYFNDY